MADDTSDAGHMRRGPSRAALLKLTAVAFVAASAAFVVAVLPAEFRLDPTGLGRLLGLDRLAGPKEVETPLVAAGGALPFYAEAPFRSDTLEITLKRAGSLFADETEWKVRLKAGAPIVYSWSVPAIDDPEDFYFAFHGQSEPAKDGTPGEMKVTTLKEDTGKSSNGALIAPYDGLWGWYLQNQSLTPVTVKLKIAGYYEIATSEEIATAAAALPKRPP
ncbi:MAG: hypothetical protein U1E56_00335 [Bauldia sp.]